MLPVEEGPGDEFISPECLTWSDLSKRRKSTHAASGGLFGVEG
jgi:hypothetical protein